MNTSAFLTQFPQVANHPNSHEVHPAAETPIVTEYCIYRPPKMTFFVSMEDSLSGDLKSQDRSEPCRMQCI